MTEGTSGTMLLEVVARVRESSNVVSLHLKVVEGTFQPFIAGQYLPLRLNLPMRPLATYTISSDPGDHSGYRISVKLDPTGKGGSHFLHSQAPVGTRIAAEQPRGRFVLPDDHRPVLLLTGGIGITPALSMLSVLARQPGRPAYFIHACRNADEHTFAAEITDMLKHAPHIKVVVAYAEACPDDISHGRCQIVGLLDRAALRKMLPLDHYHVLLCGPDGFMSAMRHALVGLGMQGQDIHQESFGGTLPIPAVHSPKINASQHADAARAGIVVRFQKSGKDVIWDSANGSLLELAEAHGLTPAFECRAGICGTCMCRIMHGTVTYTEDLIDSPKAGHVFMCCAVPDGPITLDV